MPAKIDLTCLGLDILNADELRELDKRIQQSKEKGCEYFALGIFSDELYEKMSHAKPLKPVEERMKIASFLRGIDFVFEVKELNNRDHMIKQLKEQYIKRKEEETSNLLKYANEDLVSELLPVIDNFERAIKMDNDDLSDEVSKFLEGFKMIYGNLINILNKLDVKEIEASGIEFDPNYHQAVLTEKDESKPSGVVLEVLQKGYMYKDKVIRPAMVKVNE